MTVEQNEEYIYVSKSYIDELEKKAEDAEYGKGYLHGYVDAVEMMVSAWEERGKS